MPYQNEYNDVWEYVLLESGNNILEQSNYHLEALFNWGIMINKYLKERAWKYLQLFTEMYDSHFRLLNNLRFL